MRNWLITITAACTLCVSAVPAWASVPTHRHSTPAHAKSSLRPITFPETTDDEHPTRKWEIHSSVQVSRSALRAAYEASRDAYTAKLQKYAKVPLEQAKKTISNAHPGLKVETVDLRNIRTNLVYTSVIDDDADRYLVIVDAGNGKVLLDRPLPTHHEHVFGQH